MASPFIHYAAGWVSLVSLLPFIYLLDKVRQKYGTDLRGAVYIWLSGLIMMSAVVFWVAVTDTSFLAGLSGWVVMSGLMVTYLLLALSLSIGFAIFGLAYQRLDFSPKQLKSFYIIPALWVVCEWLRAWVLSFVMAGPNTSIGPYWNFGDLGFALSVTPVGYSGRLVGLFGLGFIAVAINLCVYYIFLGRFRVPLAILAAVSLLSLSSFLGYFRPEGKFIKAAALQIGSSQQQQTNPEAFKEASKKLESENDLDLIVLPEHSAVFHPENSSDSVRIMKEVTASSESPIITSKEQPRRGNKSNTLTAYTPEGSILYENDKRFLIPIGESVPYIFEYAYSLLGRSEAIKMLRSTREITKGSMPDRTYEAGGLNIASAACSAIISPELYRNQIDSGTEVITNSASLSMFDRSSLYHQQSLQMIRFMSVSAAKPFVQSTKGSISIITDHNGAILAQSQRHEPQLISAELSTNTLRTPYVIIGEWVLLISMISVIGLVVIKQMKRSPRA